MLATVAALQFLGDGYSEVTIFATAMFVENLIQLGLSEKEAMLYLTLLKIGPSQVSSLAKRAKMKRVTVYSVLDSLGERGLVRFEQTAMGKCYMAYDPECLFEALEKEKALLKWRMDLAKDCVRKLNSSFPQQSLLLS